MFKKKIKEKIHIKIPGASLWRFQSSFPVIPHVMSVVLNNILPHGRIQKNKNQVI